MTDTINRNLVAGALAVVTVLSVAGVIGLAALERTVPDALIAIGSGGLGALAGVLLPGRPVA